LLLPCKYKRVQGDLHYEDMITEFTYGQEVKPGLFTLKDYNFQLPSFDLTSWLPGLGNIKYEMYDYPGDYQTIAQGEQYVTVRMQEEQSSMLVGTGASTFSQFSAGR